MVDMASLNEDDLDLDRVPRSQTTTSQNNSSNTTTKGSLSSNLYSYEEPPRKKIKRIEPQGERVDWTDSDGENFDGAAFRELKAKGRASRPKSKGTSRRTLGHASRIEKDNNLSLSISPADNTGVGKKAQKKRKKKRRVVRGDDDASSEEDDMEWNEPEYVQRRRKQFMQRRERLKEAGLMLPPAYEDVYFSDDQRISTLKEKPYLPKAKHSSCYRDIELPFSLGVIPAALARYLRDYQVKGAEFLHEAFVYQRGCILGDDMGLGKTVQVIAFLTAAYGKTGDERDAKRMRKMRRKSLWYPKTLIICPGSLMANWQDEFNRWGYWHTDLFHGALNQKQDVLDAAKSGMLEVMITTYTTYRLNKSAINTIAWDCVVADECHIIKEKKSEITQAMNEVNSLCRIGLTGTAIQNKYEELWTLLNWTSPGSFGSLGTWKKTVSEPLKLGQSHDATVYELALARKTAKKLVENLLPQFFLRRMKSLIKDQLPKKSDRVVFCPLTEAQADAYRNFLDSDPVQTIKGSNKMCICGSGKKAGWCCAMALENGDDWKAWVFPSITYLQRISNHLALLIPQSTDNRDKQAKDIDLLQMSMPDDWRKLSEAQDNLINASNPEFCGKWRIIKKLLKFWYDQGENKVLVFSHSVRLLKMLQALFIHTSYNVNYLDGTMNYEARYSAVQEFNDDPTQFVFLISTRAGGVGLNITSANKVIVVDPNWNPSYDLQAQDRAYRIGQTRDVEVFRLVSQGTLEEIVYARQIYKQQQASIGYNASSERRYFQGVQDHKEQKGEIFGLDNLFAYQDENVVLRDIVNKTNVAESKADIKVANLELDVEGNDGDADQMTDSDEHGGNQRSQASLDSSEKENAAMSQLAAEITGDTGARTGRGKRSKQGGDVAADTSDAKHIDPVQAILASAGVSYTHENSEVVGTSRVEAELSRRAEQAAASRRATKVFGNERDGNGAQVTGFQSAEHEFDDSFLKYRPPDDVKHRQFCSMAKWAGYGSQVVKFALLVESWTQSERRDFLERWYRFRQDCLVSGRVGPDAAQVEAQDFSGISATEASTEDDEL